MEIGKSRDEMEDEFTAPTASVTKLPAPKKRAKG
jgi:hypothetical protein